jgi:hypothetical protein
MPHEPPHPELRGRLSSNEGRDVIGTMCFLAKRACELAHEYQEDLDHETLVKVRQATYHACSLAGILIRNDGYTIEPID